MTLPSRSNTGASIHEWSPLEAGGPDHGVDIETVAVGEGDGRAGGVGAARVDRDAGLARGAGAGADQRLAVLHALADAGRDRGVHEAGGFEEAEQVAAEDPLWQRRLARADGEVHFAGAGELLGDLKAGVAAAHHEHPAVRQFAWRAVVGAVELRHVVGELLRDRRDARDLERSGGDHDLVGAQFAVDQLDAVAAVVGVERGDPAVELDGQREVTRVVEEVADDLVAGQIVVAVAGERQPGQAVVARGGEQPLRVPARAPGGRRRSARVEDRERSALFGEVVADRDAGLAAADDDDDDDVVLGFIVAGPCLDPGGLAV